MHARPSTVLATLVKKFDAKVFVVHDGNRGQADSVLDTLSMAILPGNVVFEAEGREATQALDAVGEFIGKLNRDLHW
jgi:phosphotransferase system HPr (HPr) family protein